MGAAAAIGGAGTMAFLNDKETLDHNYVKAGELDLKLDWASFYYGNEFGPGDGEKYYQPLTDDPSPMFKIDDAKPGDFGGGCVSLHVHDNPALIWAKCDLKQRENGINEPESHVDNTPNQGELAENIHVALLKFPITTPGPYNSASTAKEHVQAEAQRIQDNMPDSGDMSESDVKSVVPNCHLVKFTTLDKLCDHDGKDDKHGCLYGHRLDPNPWDSSENCFSPQKTYWYCFIWWIPKNVGNEIQSDSVKFDLTFWAEQCRHNPKAGYNPWAQNPGISASNDDTNNSSN